MSGAARASEARFIGLVNGRPRFEFDGDLAPSWLVQALSKRAMRTESGVLTFKGQPVEPGVVLTERERK